MTTLSGVNIMKAIQVYGCDGFHYYTTQGGYKLYYSLEAMV